MDKKRLTLLAFLQLMIILPIVKATAMTACALDKDEYYPGQTGFITVTIYNDKDHKVRISELTAAFDYYYTDETVYVQTFFSNATLPIEVQQDDSITICIPISLPINIAPGFTELYVRARVDLWNSQQESWSGSEYPTYRPTLYIESPYKRDFQELQGVNNVTTMMMYALSATTVIFGIAMMLLFMLARRPRIAEQPAA